MKIYQSIIYWMITAGVGYFYAAIIKTNNMREDTFATIWLVLTLVAIIIYIVLHIIVKQHDQERKEHNHDMLVDEALKTLLRQKLVSEHDRLVKFGDADDGQRTAWQSAYNSYLALCKVTDDHNGVISYYHDDIVNLPQRK